NNGQATSDAASGASTATPGKHCWRAEYSGDGVYLASSHSDNTGECFNPAGQPARTTRLSSETGAKGEQGTSEAGTATVSGGGGEADADRDRDVFPVQAERGDRGRVRDRRDGDRGGEVVGQWAGDIGWDDEHNGVREILLAGRVLGRRGLYRLESHGRDG